MEAIEAVSRSPLVHRRMANGRVSAWGVAGALLSLTACAQVPEAPNSPYFERLIAIAQADDKAHDLLEPRLPESEAGIVRGLLSDGFEPQLHGDALTRLDGFIECEGVRHVRLIDKEGRSEYFIFLLWGGPFTLPPFTSFGVQIIRDQSCAVIRATGAGHRRMS